MTTVRSNIAQPIGDIIKNMYPALNDTAFTKSTCPECKGDGFTVDDETPQDCDKCDGAGEIFTATLKTEEDESAMY